MLNRKHTVIVTDGGADDAVAIVFLLKKRSDEERVDILPVGGAVPREVAHRNIAKLLAHYIGSLRGVRLVDTAAIPQPCMPLSAVHGADGMGDLLRDAPSPVPTVSLSAFRAEGARYAILSLAPCTVTAQLLEDGCCDELVLMGGSLHTPGPLDGLEFNQALDPVAFTKCLRRPHVVATLDACTKQKYNYRGKIRAGNDLLTRLMQRACMLEARRHPDRAYMPAYVTARYFAYPTEFRKQIKKDPSGNTLTCLA